MHIVRYVPKADIRATKVQKAPKASSSGAMPRGCKLGCSVRGVFVQGRLFITALFVIPSPTL